MSLLALWQSSPEETLSKNIQTLVALATDSERLRDDAPSTLEIRTFLSEVESSHLTEFADYCTNNAFPESGFVLQDVVNEIGRRLGFRVENGRFRGVKNDIGFDGIWTGPTANLIVEVKTTDAYRINLDALQNYSSKLAEAGRVPLNTPTLIIVGRNDTGELEAQVRGSRHAWSIRIIGIDALTKLMDVNTNTSGDEVTRKIHSVLLPFEYTRLDRIVDIVFAAVSDDKVLNELLEDDSEENSTPDTRSQIRTERDKIVAKKDAAIDQLSKEKGQRLRQVKHSMYATPDGSIRAVSVVSKWYEKKSGYWYAYHEHPQREFLAAADQGYYLVGMVDREEAYAIPFEILERFWGQLGQTIRKEGAIYKHIIIDLVDGELFLRVRTKDQLVALKDYRV